MAALAFCAWAWGAECPSAFSRGEIFSAGENCGMCVAADLDGDGMADVLTGFNAMLSDGAGGFKETIALAEGPVFDAIVEDFDRDGRADVALVALDAMHMSVFFGRARESPGDALFEAPVHVPCVRNAWHMARGDLDGNGTLDVVVGSRAVPSLSILLNNGDRTFRSLTQGGMAEGTHPLAVGDFDGDGHLDIASGAGARATLLFGNGDGTFGGMVVSDVLLNGVPVFVHRFRTADFDSDGRADLVVCAEAGLGVFPGAHIERGAGLDPESSVWLRLESRGRFAEVADMSCDGLPDILVLSEAASVDLRVRCGLAPTPEAPVAFIDGEVFSPEFRDNMSVPALGDVNGDGAMDIVVLVEGSGKAQILFGTQVCALAAPGDANGDGGVNIADAVAILSHLFGQKPARCPSAVEVNGDGAVNIADPVYLLAHLFAYGPAPVGSPRPCAGGT